MKERVNYITLDQFPDLSSVMHEALKLFNAQCFTYENRFSRYFLSAYVYPLQ